MSLETVVTDIRDEARERAEEIRAEAEAQAEEIIAAAEADADEIVAAREREVESRIAQEREQKFSSAKLTAKQERLAARRDVLAEVRESVEERLASLDGDDREELTRELIDAAAVEFEGSDTVVIHARADDEDLVTDILTDYDGFEYGEAHDCLGGIVAESRTSRVRVNNTFDSILETVWENHLKDISTRLFDGDRQ